MHLHKFMDIKATVKQIIADELGFDENEIDDNANLELDLGADSLDVVELVMAIEEKFDVSVSDEDADKVVTVQDAVSLAERMVAQNQA